MSDTFGDYVTALKARDVIEELVINVLDRERPKYRYGMVESIDAGTNIAWVVYTGENDASPVQLGNAQAEVGGYVRVAGLRNDRYIDTGGGGSGGSMTIDLGEAAPGTGYSRIQYPMVGGALEEVTGALAVAGDTDTVAEVVRWDGTIAHSVETITIPATSIRFLQSVGEPFSPSDGWQMRVITVGTGAQGLSYNGKFS